MILVKITKYKSPIIVLKHSKTIRNLFIFCSMALAIGWIGVGVDRLLSEQEDEETLRMAIWLITPLIVVIVLKTFAGDGWKDAGLVWTVMITEISRLTRFI